MKIQGIQSYNKLNFTAGKSTLFTDFDGTFLPQPLNDVYSGSTAEAKEEAANFNKYFSQIQEFADKKKGNFDIIITTGRRLDWHQKSGFLPFFRELQDFGIKFPTIRSVITTEGGDIHDFLPDGSVNPIPNKAKADLVTQMSGWDNSKIKLALDEAAKETQTSYSFVNPKGSYALSIKLDDETKVDMFYKKLKDSLGQDINYRAKITEVKDYYGDFSYVSSKGIKLEPKVDEHSLHKDFDVKIALQKAIREDDFIIVAGDASNDKEMLNIFRYVDDIKNVPKTASDITQEYVSTIKDKIDNLPLKILFIRPNADDARKQELYEFVQKLQQLFPEKVQIVEQTFPGNRNNFLEAIENAINNHKFRTIPSNKNKYWKYLAFGAAGCFAIGFAIKKYFFENKAQKPLVNPKIPPVYKYFK